MKRKDNAPTGCAVITGASGGLGLEFAKLFAKDKYDLLLVARSEEKLLKIRDELRRDYGVGVDILALDLSRENAAEAVYAYAREHALRITALVNNAGFGDFGEYSAADWQRQKNMVELNVLALMHLTRLFLPDMKANGFGRILNVASVAAFEPGPFMAVYNASKSFVLSFTEAIARELKHTGVSATALCPGPVKTNFETAARLEKSGLFKKLKPSAPDKVAKFGYKKMNRGKAVAVHRASNRFLIFSIRFAPRALVRHAAYRIMKEQK